MSINPRSQPYRLDPPVEGNNLSQIVENADEMFQILFEDIVALDAGIDAAVAAIPSSSGSSTPGPKGAPGKDGTSGASSFRVPPGGNNTNFVPYVGAIRNVDLGSNTLTTPTVIGGTAVGSSLALQSTSGVGTTDFIKFTVGNAGGTEAMRILDSGIVLIGTTVANGFPLTAAFPFLQVESVVSGVNAALRVGASIGATTGTFVLAGNRAIDLQSFASIRAVNSATGAESNVANISFVKSGTDSTDNTAITFVIHNGVSSATRMIILGSGRVGIGTTAPTAELHLAAGTTAANTAPMKFTSGSLLTSAEAGAVEFLTDAYYGTITTGAARKTFAFLESPVFTTPNIGAATGTSLTLTSFVSSVTAVVKADAGGTALNINGRNNVAGESFLQFFKQDGTTAQGYIEAISSRIDFLDAGFNLVMSMTTKNLFVGGGTVPTARLHISAGTATASTAPLKFNSGTNLTTAEAGAVEYNGTNLFFTRAGTVRENVLVAIDNVAAPSTGVGVAIVNFYGASATNYLGDPNRWLSVNVLGSTYKIPLYT